MKLTLDRDDLKSEYSNINCSQTRFEHFRPQAQQTIRDAGRAVFMEYDGSNYNAIYPPTGEALEPEPSKKILIRTALVRLPPAPKRK